MTDEMKYVACYGFEITAPNRQELEDLFKGFLKLINDSDCIYNINQISFINK